MLNFEISEIDTNSKEIFDNFIDKYRKDNWDILSSYIGNFTAELVNSFSENSEELLFSLSVKKSIVKKVFSVLVEGLQNIRFHGEIDCNDKHFGIFVLAIKNGFIKILFGNLVFEEKINDLKQRLNYLSSLNENEVKEFYMKVLNNGIISDKGNAGLGFITMRLKSSNKLNFDFNRLNENIYLFTTEINFNYENINDK